MTPEMKKKLAEALGLKEVRVQNSGKVYYSAENWIGTNISIEFNPESNPAQREEVFKWLCKTTSFMYDTKLEEYWFFSKDWEVGNKDYTTALMMVCEKELSNG